MTACPWSIRWGTTAETTTTCTRTPHLDGTGPDAGDKHTGPGLTPSQTITWYAGDRREYTGPWPGYCTKLPGQPLHGGCTLPQGHHGRCAP